MSVIEWTKMKVEVRSLTKIYGEKDRNVVAIEDVNFKVKEEEFVCILGPSGCGKTTLLRIIAGLERPTSGEVLLDGSPVCEPRKDISVVFQEFALFPWRTVLGNITFGLERMGVPREERERIASQYIEMIGLRGFENAYPHELSGGMKQRVAIARALAVDPDVLLMDEPFGSLDAQTRNLFQAELLEIWENTRKTIIFVTHSVDEALFLADRILVMSARPGRIKKEMRVSLERPRDRTSIEFNRMRAEVLSVLQEETRKALALEGLTAGNPDEKGGQNNVNNNAIDRFPHQK